MNFHFAAINNFKALAFDKFTIKAINPNSYKYFH